LGKKFDIYIANGLALSHLNVLDLLLQVGQVGDELAFLSVQLFQQLLPVARVCVNRSRFRTLDLLLMMLYVLILKLKNESINV
jgi:hypothetical protein